MSKILVVDDDPNIRELVAAFLRNEGFDVYEAGDGREALARLESVKADLVILDVMMPNMDGWELDAALDEVSLTAAEDLLSQVWINLLHNSIKFTPAGGCVRVAARRAAAGVEVSVVDSGSGIAPNDQAHIFERFYKADKARRRSEGGNGLGLSIVKRIVDLHHGTVRVDSQPGQGTTFTVTLPDITLP